MHLGPPVLAAVACDGAVVRKVHRAGDIKIIPAGFSRTWEVADAARKLSIRIGDRLFETAADAMNVSYDRATIGPRLDVRDLRIEYVARALAAELESEEPAGRLYADSLGLALAAHLLRHYAGATHPRMSRGLSQRRLRHVLEYIDESAGRDLALAELASVAGVSSSHFNVLFKRSVGLSAHRYVVRRRVERALGLLAEGELPVSAVALEAGFANQSHLSVWMRRIVGTTPGAFRHGAQTFDRIRNRANLSDGGRLELLRLPTPEEEAYEQARRGMHL